VQTGTIDAKYFLFLANHGLSEDKPGTFVGQHAAPAIIDRRANSIPPIRPEQGPSAGLEGSAFTIEL
jgi:hypothetical protein